MPELIKKIDYHISPLRAGFAARARQAGLDDLDQPVERSIAKGGEPCRDVLRPALPGEELILASYGPFTRPGPYREFGPVFLLAEELPATVRFDRLPIGGNAPYFTKTFALRAYSHDERIIDALLTPLDMAEHSLQQLLALPGVAFVHARFGAYGCYGCLIERAMKS